MGLTGSWRPSTACSRRPSERRVGTSASRRSAPSSSSSPANWISPGSTPIRRIALDNPLWGQERIANELWVKLGLHVSPRTVRKYTPKPSVGRPRGDQRWATFLRNPAQAIMACDFFFTVTSTFRLLYVLVVMEHRRRRLIHGNVTAHPTAAEHAQNPAPR